MEEDLKILEDFIEGLKLYNPKTGKDIEPVQFGEGQRYVYKNVYYAIEHMLKAYKELKEENESKQKAYDNCYCEFKHYKQYESIPISLVEEKIEELKLDIQDLIQAGLVEKVGG